MKTNVVRTLHGALITSRSQVLLLQLLLGDLLLLRLVLLAEGLLLLHQADLDVAGAAHVRVDPSVSSVGPPSHLGSAVDLNMFNDQVVGVETLVLGVTLSVLQELEEELRGLERPSALGSPVHLGLGVTADTAHEPPPC